MLGVTKEASMCSVNVVRITSAAPHSRLGAGRRRGARLSAAAAAAAARSHAVLTAVTVASGSCKIFCTSSVIGVHPVKFCPPAAGRGVGG